MCIRDRTNNNTNGGGSFIEQGAQQINVQSVGLYTSVQDIEKTVVKTQNGAAIRIRDIATVTQGPKTRLGQIGRATHRPDGVIVDNPDTVEEMCIRDSYSVVSYTVVERTNEFGIRMALDRKSVV